MEGAATAFIFHDDSENESHTLGFVERARTTPRAVPTLGLLITHPLTGRGLHLGGSPSLWQAFKGCPSVPVCPAYKSPQGFALLCQVLHTPQPPQRERQDKTDQSGAACLLPQLVPSQFQNEWQRKAQGRSRGTQEYPRVSIEVDLLI